MNVDHFRQLLNIELLLLCHSCVFPMNHSPITSALKASRNKMKKPVPRERKSDSGNFKPVSHISQSGNVFISGDIPQYREHFLEISANATR
jgi:hypothetical protein